MPLIVMMIKSILAAVVGLYFVSIMVHEIGHWLPARLLKFDTPVFGIGLPCKRFLRVGKFWETEFRITPFLLLGGFIKYGGEESDKSPIWKRAVVLIGGPAMNFLLAVTLLFTLLAVIGQKREGPTTATGQPVAYTLRIPPRLAAQIATTLTVDYTRQTLRAYGQLAHVLPRPANAPPAGSAVIGPIGIVRSGASAYKSGFDQFLLYLALFNVNLFVINLLPIPILDGGGLLFLLLELLLGKPVSRQRRNQISKVIFYILVSLTVLLVLRDLAMLLHTRTIWLALLSGVAFIAFDIYNKGWRERVTTIHSTLASVRHRCQRAR